MRASTSPGRSASEHERQDQGGDPPQAPPPRPREDHRHRRAPARLGVSLITAQLVDDVAGHTLAAVSWTEASLRDKAPLEQAGEAGKLLAERAKKAGVESAVFDRGGYQYHGRVKAFAEGIREGGLSV